MTVLKMALSLAANLSRIRTSVARASCLTHSFCYSSNSDTSRNEGYSDIVISGGGMVGAAMACALGNCKVLEGKRIVLLESGPERESFTLPQQHSNRTCALSPASVRLLESFGAWKEIERMRCHPILRMQVWESCSDSMITFNEENMADSLGHMVENDVTLAGIMEALKGIGDRVEVRYNTKAQHIAIPGSGNVDEAKLPYVRLTLSDQTVLNTKLLIGADGMFSTVRKTAGFRTVNRDYQQEGVVATLILGDTTVNNTAWQRFLPSGPIAILPINKSQSSMVWTTTKENARNLKELSSERFVDAVNDALWNDRDRNDLADKALSGLRSVLLKFTPQQIRQLPPTVADVVEGSIASFPLSLIHSTQYVKPRVALIGDAAHRIHPLAGQGVNLGFGDVECLTDILKQAAKNGSDPGSLTHLLQYETERQRKNVPVMMATDGLQRLYGTSFTPLVVLRSLGLHATHSMPFLKKRIVEQASI